MVGSPSLFVFWCSSEVARSCSWCWRTCSGPFLFATFIVLESVFGCDMFYGVDGLLFWVTSACWCGFTRSPQVFHGMFHRVVHRLLCGINSGGQRAPTPANWAKKKRLNGRCWVRLLKESRGLLVLSDDCYAGSDGIR